MPRARARFRFPPRKYATRFVAAVLGLFSLLFTHEMVWDAVSTLTGKVSGRTLWMFAENLPDGRHGLIPGGAPLSQIETADKEARVRVVAPRDYRLLLSHNGFPLSPGQRATGALLLDLRLRKGLNFVTARLPAIRANYPEQREQMTILYRASTPDPPWILGGFIVNSWEPGLRYEVVGFGDPATQVPVDRGLDLTVDDAGSFRLNDSQPVRSPGEPVELRLSAPGIERSGLPSSIRLDPNRRGFQFADERWTLARKLHIRIGKDKLWLALQAEIPPQTAAFQSFSDDHDGRRVLRDLFGVCMLGPDANPLWMACGDAPDTPGMRFFPKSDPRLPDNRIAFTYETSFDGARTVLYFLPRTFLANTFPSLPGDELRIEADPELPLTDIASGARKEGNALVWAPDGSGANPLHPGLTLGYAEVDAPAGGPRSPLPADEREEDSEGDDTLTPLQRISRLEGALGESVRSGVRRLLSALPFIGLVLVLRRNPLPNPVSTQSLRAIVLTFLTLHLSFLALVLFEAALSRRLIGFIDDLGGTFFTSLARVLSSASYIQPFAVVGAVLLVDPLFRAFRRTNDTPRGVGRLLRAAGWLGFWLLVAAIPAAVVWVRMRTDPAPAPESLPLLGCLLAGGLLFLWFVLYWLLHNVLRIPVSRRDALLASGGMLLLPLLPLILDLVNGTVRHGIAALAGIYPFVLPERASPHVALFLSALLGAILLQRTGILTLRLTNHPAVWRWVLARQGLLMLLPLLIISLPVVPGRFEANVFTVTALFSFVGHLLPYALLAGAVRYVREANPTGSFDLTRGELELGALVFAWYVSGHDASVLFVPLPFLIGWALFRLFLIQPSTGAPVVSGEILARFIEERHASSRLEEAQKGLDKKFSQGDLKLADYKARLQEAKQAVNYAAAMLQNTANTLTPRVFAHGAEQTPWNNAAVAVRYGAVIAAPLMVLSMVRTVRDSRSWFPILDLTYALIASVIGWLVTAAVFGYFYHRIRGRNGFEKGMAYAFAAVAPSIPLRLLAGELPTTSAQLVSMVEVFAFVLVLALVAFDLRVLQKYRHGWREMLGIYGLASAAYGSTIAVAIASSLGGKELLPALSKFLQALVGPSPK